MNMMKFSASALAIVALSATAAAARDNVQVAGSSTVLPYATIVAEAFADRAYTAQGTLLPRGQAGAVLHDPGTIAARMVRLATEASTVSAASASGVTAAWIAAAG